IHVYVDDNQMVRVGDPLVSLDRRDYQVALDQALAQVAQARSMVIAQEPNVPITQVENAANISSGEAEVANAKAAMSAAERDREAAAAKVTESQANNGRAQADLARYRFLIAREEVSQQEYDQVAAAAKAQAANVAANEAALQSYAQIVDQRRAQSARAQLEQAQLKLTYTKITAPVAGIIMKRFAEVGSHISAGQQLLTIAQIGDVWVTANFKETQLRNIKPNQPATIHVDALKQDFEGYVLDIGGSTGAVASVLPPENA